MAAAALPRPLELALGRALGRLVHAFKLFKVKTARENIARCFPEAPEAERERLLEANYEHYGILFFEFLHFFCPIPGHWAGYAARVSKLENHDVWDRARAKGNGVLFFSAHLGFWEMSAAAAGLGGIRPTIVTTVLKPLWLHEMITSGRASTGVSAAFHPGSMPAVLKALRKGGSVAFMNDQYAPPPMGVPVRFFGHRVDTLAVVGALARRTGAAVLPVVSYRREDGVTVVRIEAPLPDEVLAADGDGVTQSVATHVEGWVRRWPEQWLWIHRRFKNAVPVET